eukprot:SAG11_NODE_1281_length_5311_cov_4.192441_1_plen_159_part_00
MRRRTGAAPTRTTGARTPQGAGASPTRRRLATPSVVCFFGLSGERYARLSIDHDGSVCHGDGTKPGWDACHAGSVVHTQDWDPPLLRPQKATRLFVAVPRAMPGDLVQATHASLGRHWAQLTAHVCGVGEVAVVLRNAGEDEDDVETGQLKLLTTKVE